MMTLLPTKRQSTSMPVCSLIQALASAVMKEESFRPLISRKYTMAVTAMPPKTPARYFILGL